MGVVDEHWCSKCKRSLDKKKDEYLELTGLNDPAVLGAVCNKDDEPEGKATRFASGLLCRKCALSVKVDAPAAGKTHKRKKMSLWNWLRLLRKKGNPNFRPVLLCLSFRECETFEDVEGGETWNCSVFPTVEGAGCRHAALDLKGRLYCKRRHPGGFEIPMEEAVVEEQKQEMVLDQVLRWLEKSPAIFQVHKAPQAKAAILEAVGLNPALLHDPDPVLTGADMIPKGVIRDLPMPGTLQADLAKALDGPWKERFVKAIVGPLEQPPKTGV